MPECSCPLCCKEKSPKYVSLAEEALSPKIPKTAHFSFKSLSIFSEIINCVFKYLQPITFFLKTLSFLLCLLFFNLPQRRMMKKHRSLWMGHKSEYSSIIRAYSCNTIIRAIRIYFLFLKIINLSPGVRKCNLLVFFECFVFLATYHISPLAVGYRK